MDVLFISPTQHNMHIRPAASLINALAPEYIFPQHFGTYAEDEQNQFWTKGYPDELKSCLPEQIQARFHRLEPGVPFVIV